MSVDQQSNEVRPRGGERFSSSWGLVLAALGMAIGAGNIWRFPRVLAANGGGAFLIAWAIFLVTWSIPILMVEFGMGRKLGRGPIGAFAGVFGPRFAVLGAFVAWCTLGIMFYYSVLTGWCVRYVVGEIAGNLGNLSTHEQALGAFESVQTGWGTVAYHAVAMALACGVVAFGVNRGIERACRILIPTLLVLIVFAAVRTLLLPGASEGLEYIFHVEPRRLADHRLWLEALSQSAWSTGAGWGLLLCYSVYARRSQPVGPSCALTGFGNNMVSMAAALVVIPTVFALVSQLNGRVPAEVLRESGPGLTGVSFVWIPVLFRAVGGGWLSVLFFLALTLAALSSLIAMVELGVRVLIDLGLTRRIAVGIVGLAGLLFGIPSALSAGFFGNQDWVWGLGLIVNGGLFAVGVIRYGVRRFRTEYLSCGRYGVGRWFDWVFVILIPLEFISLMGWWFYQAFAWTAAEGRSTWDRILAWLDPLDPYSMGTCLVQWALFMALFAACGRWLARRSTGAGDAMPAAAHPGLEGRTGFGGKPE